MLLLDTDTLPARDRAEAFQALVSDNSSTSMATFEDPAAVRATMHLFELGIGRVFNVEASGNTLRRTARMARAVNDCSIALAIPVSSHNRLGRADGQRLLRPGDLFLVDLAAPYEYGWSGFGNSYAFQVDVDQLGVPRDAIRRAAAHLHESPLYGLVRDHVLRVTSQAEQLAAGPGSAELGAATVELMRALVLSTGGDDRDRREASHVTLAAQIQRYVTDHLRDADLSPRRIAGAVGISERKLYSVYEALGVSLEQSILHHRLEAVRRDLAAPSRRHQTVTETALAWGFTNPSHFSKKFRQAYGLTPTEWRTTAMAAVPEADTSLTGGAG